MKQAGMVSQPGQFDTPILIIFWRRPEAVLKLIARLRSLRPKHLFLACDGPRDGNEEERIQVEEAREQVEKSINWDCYIEKRYSANNQGCKYGPANAIDWFFSNVEEGIILEDDCLPHLSFFSLCRELLERYRHDTRVFQISGTNLIGDYPACRSSYFFSGYSVTWGWASWRRSWRLYDVEMKGWREIHASGILTNAFDSEEELGYWTRIWACLVEFNFPVTWDYQWNYTCFSNGALSIVPRYNLVSNIGFGAAATNCMEEGNRLANLPTQALTSITHPSLVLRERAYDQAVFRIMLESEGSGPPDSIAARLWLKFYFTIKGVSRKVLRIA
jgi:hypothetical protein